jgi:hypothetical protein
MSKAAPFNIGVTAQNPEIQSLVSDILKQDHGVHGLGFLVLNPLEATRDLPLVIGANGDEIKFSYHNNDGDEILENIPQDRENIELVLSKFALSKLLLPPSEQSSRQDFNDLEKFMGVRPAIEQDPSEWVSSNPLVNVLMRRHAKYGNLLRYLCNERGLFLKVGNYATQRAYWNSSLNGGLPVYKKSDPIHEGTFMLHDVLHYVPVDPIVGSAEDTPDRKAAYIAHRMLSESCTLILADMVAVSDAMLEDTDYDVSKRKIYPVYNSIIRRNGVAPDIDKLLAANAYFCFTGDVSGFRELGAADEVLADYQSKYESVFRDDFLWNLHNYEAMVNERDTNIEVCEYYGWLNEQPDIRSLHDLDQVIDKVQGGVDIAKLLSLFRGDFKTAFAYQRSIDDSARIKIAYRRYLAGQRLIFARFASQSDPTDNLEKFDEYYAEILNSTELGAITKLAGKANAEVDSYIDTLSERGLLLPHQAALYRFSVPTYPVRFVNYERNKALESGTLQAKMKDFVQVNEAALRRVLEATQ